MTIIPVIFIGGFVTLVALIVYTSPTHKQEEQTETEPIQTQQTQPIQPQPIQPPPNTVCKHCNIPFYVHTSYTSKSQQCDQCKDFKYRLQENLLNDDEICQAYYIHVVYKVVEQSHDGYCSDPTDETETEREEDIQFAYPWILKDQDFDSDNNLINLTYFEREPEPHGNGYCGRETTYQIISAKRIKIY